MNSKYINYFLILFVASSIFCLYEFTNVSKVGFSRALDEIVDNWRKIRNEPATKPDLSNAEKEKIKEELLNGSKEQTYYCNSPYFPFLPGSNWRYQTTSGEDKDAIFFGIPAPENGKNYIDGRLMSKDKWTVRTNFACENNRITFSDINFLTVSGKNGTITTPCQLGQNSFYFPGEKEFNYNKSWQEEGCLIHSILDENYAEKTLEIKEKLVLKWTDLGEDNIKTPAGAFECEKFKGDIDSSQELSGGMKNIKSEIDVWISKGVGIIKSVYQEKSINDKSSDKQAVIQEITAFQIPTEKQYKFKSNP